MTEVSLSSIATAIGDARYADAEALSRGYLRQHPDDADARLLLAYSVHHQERFDEALDIYARLARDVPSSTNWGNYATALHDARRLEEAKAAFATALEHPPVEAETLLAYGNLLTETESWQDARSILLFAHRLDPGSVKISLAAAHACNICGDYRIDDLIAGWREWLPLDDTDQLLLAHFLFSIGQYASAYDLLQEVIARAPPNAAMLLQLASVYERLNRLPDAEATLAQITALHSETDDATHNDIEHLRATLALRHNEAPTARRLLETVGPRNDSDAEHYFELAKACDTSGDTEAVMAALIRAHALQIDHVSALVPEEYERNGPVFQRARTRVSVEDYATWPALAAPTKAQSPVFVVGFPRSGTTLLEQMLDAHPRLQSMDERPFFNVLADQLQAHGALVPRDLGKLSQADVDELRKGYLVLACGKVERRWDTRLVDKNPLNMLWLPMIYRMFPNAQFILALRDPRDVILSCYQQNFRSHVLQAACADLPRLARGYVEAMQHWLHHVEVFAPDVMVSRYEDLVADTPGQLARIARFLGLDNADAMLGYDERVRQKEFIATPSYRQVTEPVSKKAVGRWQSYRKYFEPLLPILDPMLEHWGYLAQ